MNILELALTGDFSEETRYEVLCELCTLLENLCNEHGFIMIPSGYQQAPGVVHNGLELSDFLNAAALITEFMDLVVYANEHELSAYVAATLEESFAN